MTLAWACLAWVLASSSVAAWATIRSRGRRRPTLSTNSRLLLLRPCAGRDHGLERALASSIEAGPHAAVRFLVESELDEACGVAREIARTLADSGQDARVVVTGARGPNRKAAQLARALAEPDVLCDIVIVADGDVELSREAVAAILGPLGSASADAVWAPPIEVSARTTADRASQAILDASLHAFVLLSALDRGGMVGKLFGVRRDAIERVGGFGEMAAFLGEDMEIARRLHGAGCRVVVSSAPAASLAVGRTWRAVVDRYARWVLVIRAQRPWLLLSYPMLFAAAPLQLLLGGVAAALEGGAGLAAMAAAMGARWCVAVAARRRSGRSLEGLMVAPWLADVTLLLAFGRAVSSRELRWRGVPLRIERGGTLAEVKR